MAQITRALEAVSASRVRRAQAQVMATRPYAAKSWQVLTHLASQTTQDARSHPLLTRRDEVNAVGIVLLTSDRGLIGAFNLNMVRKTLDFIKERGNPAKLITVGRKGRDLMWRSGQRIVAEFSKLPANPTVLDITPIARAAIDDFLSGDVDEVYLAYTDFINTLRQRPVVLRLLPIQPAEVETQAMAEYVDEAEVSAVSEYLYEPSPPEILDSVLPRFTELQVYQAVLESLASEHAARMMAMRNATENADALTDELTVRYNKARQQAITMEILDIAGGAEALVQAMKEA
ncbi:MAG: ATP synthase F1 subunit gamma [Burkholderiales bacterium]|nr:ATP synthase F1 subunit gamma [Burkholderiales bacterium]